MSARILLVAGLLAASIAPAAERSALRHALVVGNAAYAEAPLRNPVNDARAMAAMLERLGFRVTTLLDADRARRLG